MYIMLFRKAIEGIMDAKMERQKSTSSYFTLADVESLFDEFFLELNEREVNGSGWSIPHNTDNDDVGNGRARSDSMYSNIGNEYFIEFEDSYVAGQLQQPTMAQSRRSSITGISSLSGGMHDFQFDDIGIMDHDFNVVLDAMNTLTSDTFVPCFVTSNISEIELADQNFHKVLLSIRSDKKDLINSLGGCSIVPDCIKSLPTDSIDLKFEDESVTNAPLDNSASSHKVVPPVKIPVVPKVMKAKNANRYYNRVPKVKIYSTPTKLDVLLGRGGHVNNHSGNKKYLAEKAELKYSYNEASKEEKTRISQALVDAVKEWGGKFLKEDDEGWYQVENIVARKKASQTLRERDDRAKKKARTQFDGGTQLQ